jgi:hypothetical protein
MPTNPPPELLQTLLTIMQKDSPPGYFLNQRLDIYAWSQHLMKDIEDKRSAVTALTQQQATNLGPTNLQFSAVKHESRINALYRLIGLPTELDLGGSFSLLDENGKVLTTTDTLAKSLVDREYDQLQNTFKQFLSANSVSQLNTKLDSAQADELQLIAGLYDPHVINTNRLFPVVQFSQIQSVVEARNRIAPAFASMAERYINGATIPPSFLESVITIRLLPQSGGATINTQGAVEIAVIQALGYALGELAKQYNRNQSDAEKTLLDGIALIRNKISGINSAAVKQASTDANARDATDTAIVPEGDIRRKYTKEQLTLYSAIISLLPLDNDVIPIGQNIDNTPFTTRSIKDNALTGSFSEIINANVDAINRALTEDKKVLQKRQLTQDKLTAELGSAIGDIGGISLAEIVMVIAALFVLDENDLVGLIPDSRFNQLISATNNNTTTSNQGTTSSGTSSTSTQQINIFNILQQFKNTRTSTNTAVGILQDTIGSIYTAFKIQLGEAHKLPST